MRQCFGGSKHHSQHDLLCLYMLHSPLSKRIPRLNILEEVLQKGKVMIARCLLGNLLWIRRALGSLSVILATQNEVHEYGNYADRSHQKLYRFHRVSAELEGQL